MSRYPVAAVLALVLISLLAGGCQQAASYPSKAVEYVVHSSPGGGGDIMVRRIVDMMSKEKIISQPLVVVNKPGGSGAVADAFIYEKKGDPYFLYNISGVQMKNPLLGTTKTKLADLTPVVGLVFDVVTVVVNANSPYKTLPELIEASKTSAKPLTQGGGSITSDENITGYLIRKGSGAKWEFASYPSGGEAVTALLGGHVDLGVPSPAEVMEQVRAGSLRPLAVSTEQRMELWPDVPTLKELGLPYRAGTPRGVAMPREMPPDAVKYWEDAFYKLTQTQAWKDYLKEDAWPEAWMPSKQFGDYMATLSKSYEEVMTEMGIIKK
jgi:putative tricarboxylic transport membrane protein